MTNPPEDTLLKVAERVSDGNPVDWEAAVKLHGESLETLEQLRLLSALAEAHQRVRPHRTAPTPPEPGPPQPAHSTESPKEKPAPFSSSRPTSPYLWLALAIAATLVAFAGWYLRRFFD